VVRRDVIVIGASAGGVRALVELVPQLPANLKASIFVTIHLSPTVPSFLPELLTNAGPLRAIHPASGQAVEYGTIYIAPPDHHMIIEDSVVQLWRGPKENRHRPAINPLFRSAAFARGVRVVGVVMTGLLDDGSAGLWMIKRQGGVAIVQDPSEAAFPDMVESAIEYVEIDHVVSLSRMGPLLTTLVNGAKQQAQTPGILGPGEVAP
jgi:two-component system chemotaxis response regulator CheB